MEDKHTRDFFAKLCKDEEEIEILNMLLSGISSKEIIEKYLDKDGNNQHD